MARQGTFVMCDVCGKYVSARGIGGHRRLKHQLKVKNIYKTFQETNSESQLSKPNAWVRTGNQLSKSNTWIRTGSQLPESESHGVIPLVRVLKSVPSGKIIRCNICNDVVKGEFCYGFYEESDVMTPGLSAPFCRNCLDGVV